MSFALVELKRLLVSGDTLVGAVMGIEGNRISVATPAGAAGFLHFWRRDHG
jgi:hypothetical protein